MQPVENAVIAAAGLGSRLGLGHPKCMLELGGITLLTRMIRMLELHVSRIHVVIGYREDLIIDYCARYHPQVVLVRNPEFRITNTAQSFALGARYLRGKCVFLDGDLVINPDSFGAFLDQAARPEILVGLCQPNTENAVFVNTEESAQGLIVTGFTRENRTLCEWANVFTGPSTVMNSAENYVFEHLAKLLPLSGHMLELAEIDTSADMRSAESFVLKHGL
ncbi:NTP transferase domain-containing protein [Nitrosomonas sp. H1_AOB3]|uniref:NTP transferase domain-containing protein n=1 Tax=Nitrosomonas sp. H1_AOB3 TaxID=2741553 RepID=UPI001935B36F|nr:NTP transferase domain-containing protein [Nitrosomonas sp. H1_AOB3]QOJ09265.1 MAG: NTP transferase domain-containing protein [Nitrosomonas sp. H1_AOB3]